MTYGKECNRLHDVFVV